MAEFLSCCVRVFNLRSYDPRFTFRPHPSTQSHFRLCITTQMAEFYWSEVSSLLFVGYHKRYTLNIMGAERRAQVRPTCSIFEQKEPLTENQVKMSLLRSISLKILPQIMYINLKKDKFLGQLS
jgi:hypothetical protein